MQKKIWTLLFLFVGCDKDKPPLPGKREFLLDHASNDKQCLKRIVRNYKAPHFQIPKQSFELSIGEGSSKGILPEPVFSHKHIYVLDGRGIVRCFLRHQGKLLWEKQLLQEDQLWGGGLALQNDILFAALSSGDVYALNAYSGKIAWKVTLKTPIKSAPEVKGNFLVLMTTELMALNTSDGKTLWKTPIPLEYSSIMGHAKPIIDGESVFVILPSGEVQVCHLSNGQPLWTETLSSDDVIPHARALPVVDHQDVFAVSYAGNLIKLERRSGKVLWNKALNVTQKPALSGKCLFVISQGKDLLCVNRDNGFVNWLQPLSEDGLWFGPVIVGKYLVMTSQEGIIAWHDMETGQLLKKKTVSGTLSYAPIFSERQYFVRSDEGTLWAFESNDPKD